MDLLATVVASCRCMRPDRAYSRTGLVSGASISLHHDLRIPQLQGQGGIKDKPAEDFAWRPHEIWIRRGVGGDVFEEPNKGVAESAIGFKDRRNNFGIDIGSHFRILFFFGENHVGRPPPGDCVLRPHKKVPSGG